LFWLLGAVCRMVIVSSGAGGRQVPVPDGGVAGSSYGLVGWRVGVNKWVPTERLVLWHGCGGRDRIVQTGLHDSSLGIGGRARKLVAVCWPRHLVMSARCGLLPHPDPALSVTVSGEAEGVDDQDMPRDKQPPQRRKSPNQTARPTTKRNPPDERVELPTGAALPEAAGLTETGLPTEAARPTTNPAAAGRTRAGCQPRRPFRLEGTRHTSRHGLLTSLPAFPPIPSRT
jgi:hypothetical protein